MLILLIVLASKLAVASNSIHCQHQQLNYWKITSTCKHCLFFEVISIYFEQFRWSYATWINKIAETRSKHLFYSWIHTILFTYNWKYNNNFTDELYMYKYKYVYIYYYFTKQRWNWCSALAYAQLCLLRHQFSVAILFFYTHLNVFFFYYYAAHFFFL